MEGLSGQICSGELNTFLWSLCCGSSWNGQLRLDCREIPRNDPFPDHTSFLSSVRRLNHIAQFSVGSLRDQNTSSRKPITHTLNKCKPWRNVFIFDLPALRAW